ncbi:PEP/pyruvate-binding domain-containing protein [Isoptericola sp. NPDC019693]|uniref:PEP/pyruvate-binding domain-containing protein n=1 Tax=Isoptericola sp. NPDC019693 TaxID=3364009 RepID=UPI0037A6DF9A
MPLTVPLDDATPAHGGKAAALGALRRAGLPVPDGFVVPAGIAHADLPDAVAAGTAALAARVDVPADAPVAVRSSAADEDGAHASAAGQYDSVLGVAAVERVVDAVAACRASATGPRATAYRAATAGDPGRSDVSVIVQRMVDARAAGVLFTGDGRTVVEASWGLGESVVQGAVDPDRWTVMLGPVDGGRVVERVTGSKRTRVDLSPGGPTTRDVPASDRDRPCLDDETVLRLAGLGATVAALRGGPQDVEWAVDDAGTIWLLQARPVTAALPSPERCERDFGDNSRPNSPRNRAHNTSVVALRGTGASGGRASGPARVVHGPDDFGTVRPGDVLVCRETDPAWTPLFGVVAAVVTETGGLLSHAAIVARELGLPAVLGVPDATAVLRDAGRVTVDGDAGDVRPA